MLVELVPAPAGNQHRCQRRTLRGHPPGAQMDPVRALELDLHVPERQGDEEDERAAECRSHPPTVRMLEDHLHPRRSGPFAERDGEDATLTLFGPTLLAVYEDALRGHDAAQLQSYLRAPGDERALAFTEADDDAAVRGLAGDLAPGVLTFFIAEAVPSILVERGFSLTLRGVDEQRQRVVRPLARVGRIGSHSNRGISLYVEGGFA